MTRSATPVLRTREPPHHSAIVHAATTDFCRPSAMHLPREEVVGGDPELQRELRRLQYRSGDEILPARQVCGAVLGPQGCSHGRSSADRATNRPRGRRRTDRGRPAPAVRRGTSATRCSTEPPSRGRRDPASDQGDSLA